jgi:lysophospholipase L1-like esterase
VSGTLASRALADQLPKAVAAKPTLVTMWLGVNDLNAQVDATTYATTLNAIVDVLTSGTEARVFIGNVPDLRAVPVYAALPEAALAALSLRSAAYNAAIAAAAARAPTRVTVVDLNTGSAALVSSGTVAGDGFHPSDAGYALIADRFAAALRATGVPLQP